MDKPSKLTRPDTLEEGKKYLRGERQPASDARSITPVTFVAYDPCPAFVIVWDCLGRRTRCPREEVFER